MSSRPALVRVSAIITSPCWTRMPAQYVIGCPHGTRWNRAASALRLALSGIHSQRNVKRLVASAAPRPADWRGSEVIEADRDPHMGIRRADAVRWIEADPAEARHSRLGPGMRRFLLDHAVRPVEVAGHITGRDAEVPRGGDEYVGQVLANAAP